MRKPFPVFTDIPIHYRHKNHASLMRRRANRYLDHNIHKSLAPASTDAYETPHAASFLHLACGRSGWFARRTSFEVQRVNVMPQTPASYALLAGVLPGLAERLSHYRVHEGTPDPELFGVFVGCLDDTLSAVRVALEGGDLHAVSRQAHALKGMGGAAGAAEISVLGETMEAAARTGQEGTVRALASALNHWRNIIG